MPPDQPIEIPEGAFEALEEFRAALEQVVQVPFGVAVGLKEANGEITDEVALCVYLEQKLPDDQVPGDQRIPATFGDFSTDVVERQWRLAQGPTAFHDPVIGGVQIGHSGKKAVEAGTLGVLVRRRQGGAIMGLTNCHVVKNNEFAPLDLMFQPAVGARLGLARENDIGGLVDCALVEVEPPRGHSMEILGIGPVRGSERMRFLWQPVRKSGAITGVTTGRTLRVGPGPYPLDTRERGWDQTYSLNDQIEIVADDPTTEFLTSGDSGSALVTVGIPGVIDENKVIGLCCAEYSSEIRPLGSGRFIHYALANQIENVLTRLDVDVAVAPTVTSVSPNSAVGAVGSLGNVAIDGFGFDGVNQVLFGQTPAIVLNQRPNHLEVIPPLQLPGVVDVLVQDRFGEWSAASNASKFTYEQVV